MLLRLGVAAQRLGSADDLRGDKYPVGEFAQTGTWDCANWVRPLNLACPLDEENLSGSPYATR